MASATISKKSEKELFEEMMADDRECGITRFAYVTRASGKCKDVDTLQGMLDKVTEHSTSERGMCFIENASSRSIKTLQSRYNIPDEFFIAHATTSSILETWQNQHLDFKLNRDKWVSLQGLYIQTGLPSAISIQESKRNWYRHILDERSKESEGESSRYSNTTRISYCKLEDTNWYLFLIDYNKSHFPQEYAAQGRVRIRFPALSHYSGGLQLLLNPYEDNLFKVIKKCFNHLWTVALMLQSDLLVSPQVFGYMLVTSTNDDRLTRLRRNIRDISFHNIRKADISITNELHDAREEMALARDAIKETSKYQQPSSFDGPGLQPRIDNLTVDAEDLHQFFTETLQLIAQINIIRDAQNSAQQAQESLKQTKQATLLTGLAAVYLPLSLATGIWGMNVQEVNQTGHKITYFIVTVIVLIICTFLALVVARLLQRTLEESSKKKEEVKSRLLNGHPQSVERIDSDLGEKPGAKKVWTMKSFRSPKVKSGSLEMG